MIRGTRALCHGAYVVKSEATCDALGEYPWVSDVVLEIVFRVGCIVAIIDDAHTLLCF